MLTTGHAKHDTLASAYDYLCRTQSDIHQHLPVLARLGTGRHVVEIGFRTGVSAVAFLHGGCHSLVSYDIEDCPLAQHVALLAGDRFRFEIRSSRLGPPEHASHDVLFIDGDHSYEGCLSDLNLWSPSTWQHIALHDTYALEGPAKALTEFLQANKSWKVSYHTQLNNGLTVLSR